MGWSAARIVTYAGVIAGMDTRDTEVRTACHQPVISATIVEISGGLHVAGAGALRG